MTIMALRGALTFQARMSSSSGSKRKLDESQEKAQDGVLDDDGFPQLEPSDSLVSTDDELETRAKGKMPHAGFVELGDRLEEFLKRIPKTDLHVHLDGSIRLSTLIELAQKHGVTLPAYTEEELRQLVFKDNYESLEDYLKGFSYITAVMQQPAALERIAYEFAVDNFEEGVHYVEPRFAPQLLATSGEEMDIIAVLKHVNNGLSRAKREFNNREEVVSGRVPPYTYSLILCAMRMFLSDFSQYYKDFVRVHQYESPKRIYQLASIALVHAAIAARNDHGLPVVGIDIAGAEKGFPASEHRETFELAHKAFLFKTVHGGEDWGPESIFQAITDLHAERVGHGFHIFNASKCTKKSDPQQFVKGLVDYVAKNRIMLEVCLTSNRQTMPELRNNIRGHAIKDMLAHGLCISLNTDNRLVSNTTVCKELALAIRTFNISPTELKTIVLEGFKRAFFSGTYMAKRSFVRECIWYYEKIEREFGLHDFSISLGGGPQDHRDLEAGSSSKSQKLAPSQQHPMEHHVYSPNWSGHAHRHHHMEVPPEILM